MVVLAVMVLVLVSLLALAMVMNVVRVTILLSALLLEVVSIMVLVMPMLMCPGECTNINATTNTHLKVDTITNSITSAHIVPIAITLMQINLPMP